MKETGISDDTISILKTYLKPPIKRPLPLNHLARSPDRFHVLKSLLENPRFIDMGGRSY